MTDCPVVIFRVNTIPVGQPRAKACGRGGFVRMYTPDTADQFKADVRRAALQEWDGVKLEGPLKIHAMFILPRPQGHYHKRKSGAVLRSDAPQWCSVKPDIDNLTKAAMDAMSDRIVKGITDAGLWYDDCQVAWLDVRKVYTKDGSEPAALVSIYRLDQKNEHGTHD